MAGQEGGDDTEQCEQLNINEKTCESATKSRPGGRGMDGRGTGGIATSCRFEVASRIFPAKLVQ